MSKPNFDQVLFPDSPFVPPATIQSALNIHTLVQNDKYHPAIAIARELRDLFGEHIQFLDAQNEWLMEKFSIGQVEIDDYYFGLLVPVTLIIAAELSRYNHLSNVLDFYFPTSNDQFFIDLRNYGTRHIPLVRNLLHLGSPDPMFSAKPVYKHCGLEVFSFSQWYQVGLEAGQRTFKQFAKLY